MQVLRILSIASIAYLSTASPVPGVEKRDVLRTVASLFGLSSSSDSTLFQACSTSSQCSSGLTCCAVPGDVSSTACLQPSECAAADMSRASVMRAVVKNWETCQPNGVDSCASNGFVCCIAKDDLATRKSTCRPQNMCSDSNNNGNTSGNKIADWQTCQLGRDSCSNSNYVCCVASADLGSNKATCRPQKECSSGNNNTPNTPISDVGGPCNQAIQNAAVCRTGLVCNPPAVAMPGAAGTCALPNNNNGGGSQGGNKVADWQTCQQGRDSCVNNNYVCCVASADLGSNKATCRPQNDCSNNGGNNGNNNSGNNGGNNVGNKIADWQTCQFGRDSCLNNNYVCCVAQADLGLGKATCRPKDQCGNTNGGNSNNGNNNGGSGKLVPMWENCGLTDTCANGFVCCAAKADLVGGKTTCRPTNDCGNSSWLAQCTKDDWMCGTDRKTLYQCTPSKMNMWVWAPKKECDIGLSCYDDGKVVGCR